MAAKTVSTDLFAPTTEEPAEPSRARVRASKHTDMPALPDGPRRSVSFYFAPSTSDALDAAWADLRKAATQRGKVTKSAIVEAAVLAALQDLEKNGDASMLARMLAS